MKRILEFESTQNDLAREKMTVKVIEVEELRAKIDREKMMIGEQKKLKEKTQEKFEDFEKEIQSLADILKLNENLVSGMRSRGFDLIRKKVRHRLDGSIANRQIEFTENLIATVEK